MSARQIGRWQFQPAAAAVIDQPCGARFDAPVSAVTMQRRLKQSSAAFNDLHRLSELRADRRWHAGFEYSCFLPGDQSQRVAQELHMVV
jgi:hypothetical protein